MKYLTLLIILTASTFLTPTNAKNTDIINVYGDQTRTNFMLNSFSVLLTENENDCKNATTAQTSHAEILQDQTNNNEVDSKRHRTVESSLNEITANTNSGAQCVWSDFYLFNKLSPSVGYHFGRTSIPQMKLERLTTYSFRDLFNKNKMQTQ